ncbi:hypothetical protein [Methylovirgula sp. HY1]|uniref:hypothetical protein n=1 Tax=Methylovirgula sp. HY1 TaxID=2822761 RepID=UPI001C5AB624|nr:hypothetical protein [Methylovirgula sp. HY1]
MIKNLIKLFDDVPWRTKLRQLVIFTIIGIGLVCASSESIRFIVPSLAEEQKPAAPVAVTDPKDCPSGYSILYENRAEGNRVGYSLPADAKICLVKNEANMNGTGYQIRPAGK